MCAQSQSRPPIWRTVAKYVIIPLDCVGILESNTAESKKVAQNTF